MLGKHILYEDMSFQNTIIFALICAELFLGVGQVFFLQAEHIIAWTIIYCYLQISMIQYADKDLKGQNKQIQKYRYLK